MWYWCPVSPSRTFTHPADLPVNDEALAKKYFLENVRGPRIARIKPVTMLRPNETKDSFVVIMDGREQEVPISHVIHWHEGLFLLDQLAATKGLPGHFDCDWFTDELQRLLVEETRQLQVPSIRQLTTFSNMVRRSYIGRSKLNDGTVKYRRRSSDVQPVFPAPKLAVQEPGYYDIKDITDFMPAWEAFCDKRCGVYQDFYLVRWDVPHSDTDFSASENGGGKGLTWEPDECIPEHLDELRLRAKEAWLAQQASRPPLGHRQRPTPTENGLQPSGKRPREEENGGAPPPRRRAKLKRNGQPLLPCLIDADIGHDFEPLPGVEESLERYGEGEDRILPDRIISAWPKAAQDYPAGHAAAGPPGHCFDDCNCMDDHRLQLGEELRKSWLEEPGTVDAYRNSLATSAVNSMAQRLAGRVTKRGEVSGRHFFETNAEIFGASPSTAAALDLSSFVIKAIRAVLQEIPFQELTQANWPVVLPAAAFLLSEEDLIPVRFAVVGQSPGSENVVTVHPDTGAIHPATKPPLPPSHKVQLDIELKVMEASTPKVATIFVVPSGDSTRRTRVQEPVIQRLLQERSCPLLQAVREALKLHLEEIYDFQRHLPLEQPLGRWLEVMSRVLRMLRASTGTTVAPQPAPVPHPPGMISPGASRLIMPSRIRPS